MLCVFCLWCRVSTQPRSASESNVHRAFGGLPIPQGQVPPRGSGQLSAQVCSTCSPLPLLQQSPESHCPERWGDSMQPRPVTSGAHRRTPARHSTAHVSPRPVFLHSEPIPGQNTFSSIERIRRASKAPPAGATGDRLPSSVSLARIEMVFPGSHPKSSRVAGRYLRPPQRAGRRQKVRTQVSHPTSVSAALPTAVYHHF